MNLYDAVELLSKQLNDKYPMHFTVGHDLIDKIYVYELKRGHSKERLKEFHGFEVVNKYVGTISAKPAKRKK